MAFNRIHSTKVDLWLICVLCVSLAICVISVLRVSHERPEESGTIIFAVVGAWVLLGLVCWPTSYRIEDDTLVVRSGLLKWVVPLVTIYEVEPTSQPISAPAWSLDRLVVRFRKGASERSICVSPKDQISFMNDLVAVDPNLIIVGDRIQRRGIEGL